MKNKSVTPLIELWIKQLNESGWCDITDHDVENLIREFSSLDSNHQNLIKEQAAFVQGLTAWHKQKVASLQLVIDKRDASISLGKGIPDIEAGSEKAKGVRIGIILPLTLLGKLPFSVDEDDDDGDQ
ncbi:hypothetical protein [Candidatus Erwinia dacicola]|uniref:Uncharacterized protein n=1 Tax=Candidatus Erwinia dacicola TaxID=252393 RepID=A0A1E7Z1H6_9GAMM|nr:hypothetical protein [Candidatus Erwinia dacicola]OFC62609.1 hypothetical protein BBW68_08875 [Candidatus Erwinia dacicola]RAP71447.1 hypothetical protein ACZ87_01743 [Candidatus Erwinia dacicola]